MTPTDLTFAIYSELAYESLAAVQLALPDVNVTLLDRDDSQAYVIETETETVVAFRGTQVTSGFSMTDVIRNAKVRLVTCPIGGKVHRGYKEGVNVIADDLAKVLARAKLPHYFTGHSLGGSEATYARTLEPHPVLTVTFGAPKVGNREFVRAAARYPLMRYSHGRDIAPKHPRPWQWYCHGGVFKKLGRDGTITERKWSWRDELIIPFFKGIVVGTFDHRIGEYCGKLRGAEI